jgi:hypothetical protein
MDHVFDEQQIGRCGLFVQDADFLVKKHLEEKQN